MRTPFGTPHIKYDALLLLAYSFSISVKKMYHKCNHRTPFRRNVLLGASFLCRENVLYFRFPYLPLIDYYWTIAFKSGIFKSTHYIAIAM